MHEITIRQIKGFCIANNYQCEALDGYINIKIGCALFCIEQRPSYCDRGRFTIKAFTSDYTRFYIDDADGFPRYFFKMENLLSELKEYIDFNKNKILK